MKEGTIIKLKKSILLSSNTIGRLLVVLSKSGDTIIAKPIGGGWDKYDLAVPNYQVPETFIDKTYKHEE